MNAKPVELAALLAHPDAPAARAVVDKEGYTPLGRAEVLREKEYGCTPAFTKTLQLLEAEESTSGGAEAGGSERVSDCTEEDDEPTPLKSYPSLPQPPDTMMCTSERREPAGLAEESSASLAERSVDHAGWGT